MSITLTINNDRDESIVESYDCQYCDGKGCVTTDGFKYGRCDGSGKIVFKSSRWEVQMANGNFSTVWSALGLNVDWCGSIDARTVLAAIRSFRPALATRPTKVEKREGGATIIDCGIGMDYISERIEQIREVAEEAAKREELLTWG